MGRVKATTAGILSAGCQIVTANRTLFGFMVIDDTHSLPPLQVIFNSASHDGCGIKKVAYPTKPFYLKPVRT